MAKKKDFYEQLDGFFEELIAEGMAARWKVDKKIKQAEHLRRKTARKIREEQIIIECLDEYKAKKSA
jgi:hypothetical protein